MKESREKLEEMGGKVKEVGERGGKSRKWGKVEEMGRKSDENEGEKWRKWGKK